MHVGVEVDAVLKPCGVRGDPPRDVCCVVALFAVVQRGFLVLFFSRIAEALPADLAGGAARTVAGVAVGVVLLVADDVRGCVEFERCGAEVVV